MYDVHIHVLNLHTVSFYLKKRLQNLMFFSLLLSLNCTVLLEFCADVFTFTL